MGKAAAGAHVASNHLPHVTEAGVREARLYPVLVLGMLVFTAVFPWHTVNQRLPIWDGADYVLTAQNIVGAFNEGLLHGIRAMYLERGWRPIIFPTVASPFFLLTGGQIRLSVGLAQLTIAFVLALYVYGFLRQEFSSWRALTGALLIVGAEFIINFSSIFFSELFWLAATAGTAYHLAMAMRRPSVAQFVCAGVWLGLMGAVRPIETVVLLVIAVPVFLGYCWKCGSIKAADLGWFALQLALASCATVLLTSPQPHSYIVVGLLASALLIIGSTSRRLLRDGLPLAFLVVAELVALGWHVPTIRALYLWARETSVGLLVQLGERPYAGLGPLAIFGQAVKVYSPHLLIALTILATTSAIAAFASGKHPRVLGLVVIGIGVMMMVPMLVAYSVTGASDPRRIMPCMLLLYIGLTTIALAPEGWLRRARIIVLVTLAIAQWGSAVANGLNVPTRAFANVQNMFGYLRQPAVGKDPNEPVLDGLLALGIKDGNLLAYSYCYRDYDKCERDHFPPFEPMALSTLARERHLGMYVHFIGNLDFSKPDTLSAQIQANGFRYVLIDMFDTPGPLNRADPYVDHTQHFISIERGTLPKGLANRGCFNTLNRPICVIEVTG